MEKTNPTKSNKLYSFKTEQQMTFAINLRAKFPFALVENFARGRRLQETDNVRGFGLTRVINGTKLSC